MREDLAKDGDGTEQRKREEEKDDRDEEGETVPTVLGCVSMRFH